MRTKILVVYSTVVTTLLAVFVLAGFAAPKVQRFDEIDVHRINVREADGTLRMVISNQARLPGVTEQGKSIRRLIGRTLECFSITTKGLKTAVSYSVVAEMRTEMSSTLERAFHSIATARTLRLFGSRE
jgi:hypothetical protein